MASVTPEGWVLVAQVPEAEALAPLAAAVRQLLMVAFIGPRPRRGRSAAAQRSRHLVPAGEGF